MAGNEYYPTRPHEAQNPARIAAGSPLAVLGICLEILRERFRDDAGLDIVWREDPATTDILIEIGYNAETEGRNFGRALFVTRLNTVPQQISIGNRVGVRLPDHLEGFTSMMSSDISIDCVSNDAGESMMLGDIVQHFLLASRLVIGGWYGIHDVSDPTLGQTSPYAHDQDKWNTPVSLRFTYQVRWSSVKIRPLLKQIASRAIDSATGKDASGTPVDTALISLERRFPLVPPGPDSGAPIVPATPPPTPGVVLVPENALWVPNQRLLGLVDGANLAYLVSIPFVSGDVVREVVYRNGVRVDPSTYSVSSSRLDGLSDTITFQEAPVPGDLLVLDAYVMRH